LEVAVEYMSPEEFTKCWKKEYENAEAIVIKIGLRK
jgi:hypothetical protein